VSCVVVPGHSPAKRRDCAAQMAQPRQSHRQPRVPVATRFDVRARPVESGGLQAALRRRSPLWRAKSTSAGLVGRTREQRHGEDNFGSSTQPLTLRLHPGTNDQHDDCSQLLQVSVC
jgi:hypothetical protein